MQNSLTDHTDAAVLRHERTLAPHYGLPAAVLLPFEELRALEEHRQQLADAADTASLRAALDARDPSDATRAAPDRRPAALVSDTEWNLLIAPGALERLDLLPRELRRARPSRAGSPVAATRF